MKLAVLLPLLSTLFEVEALPVVSKESPIDSYEYFADDFYNELEAISSYSEDSLLPLNVQQEECIKELNLDREETASLSTQEFPPEDDVNFNEFFSCSWKKQGYQYANGLVNFDVLEKITFDDLCQQAGDSISDISLARLLAEISVDDCREVRGSSDGQTAVKVYNCIYRRLLVLAKENKHLSSNKESK